MALTQKLRVGVMSTANIARKNILAIKLTDCAEVVAVASRNLDKAKKYAEENGVTTAYGSYQELLDDSNIDAVYIPLPTNMHKEWVTKAAQAGMMDSDEAMCVWIYVYVCVCVRVCLSARACVCVCK
eukprot:TRINITY_DN11430_c0_g1_i1.p2 TRINITY_DN11430_c0_g1~~TRINITY_DN11430_c0_g1_i1.p2  ORF type:complete len:127 (+),score=24.73 TRINITY_DN11430_c0_g1_i1:4-384(+)